MEMKETQAMQQQIAAQEAEANRQAMLQSKQIPAQAVVDSKTIQSQATSQDNERSNMTKKEIADLQNQVKILTKQMEHNNKGRD
jgi:hypothetical protein